MSINNKVSQKNALQSANYGIGLIKKAKELIKTGNEVDALTSAIIFSSICEDMADGVYEKISLEVVKKLIKFNIRLIRDQIRKNDKTNLESSITRLNYFEFPYKSELMINLEKVRAYRNELIHSLFILPEKNLNLNVLANNIATCTYKIYDLWKKIKEL